MVDDLSQADPGTVVSSLLAAWRARDKAGVLRYFADDAVYGMGLPTDVVPYGGETSGRPVPADAPPLFTCIAQDDRMLFKVVEGLYADWSNADRPAELHIFPRGGHGFGMVPQNKPIDRWLGLMEDWLADLGHLTS